MKADCAIIGGGIVGLSVAMHLLERQPGLRLILLEKEAELASHQTGRNSGVIHSGIYYRPGSLKARFGREGNRSMRRFCETHGIAHEICGKLIVATSEEELPLLQTLHQRGIENELEVTELQSDEVKEIEPAVKCLRALRVPSTGIVSYREVASQIAQLIRENGGTILTGAQVHSIDKVQDGYQLGTSREEIATRFLINCAGLQSDRVAERAGAAPAAKIVPFRGEYYELVPERRNLVRGLIYPVPHPAFPFLGVHFTKMIDGSVHAGPNAVLAFKREGYGKGDVAWRDLTEMLTYRGLWKLARRHYREGWQEIWRSFSKEAFVKSLQRLIPEIKAEDLVPAPPGVRAQALRPSGELVDDFLLLTGQRAIHVCNAPSPAATASLEIGKAVADQVPQLTPASPVSLSYAE